MSSERKPGAPRTFVTVVLPWILGGSAFLLYLCTINPWISLQSLGSFARVSGWVWQPQLRQPLTAVVVYPLHFLPETWVPLALNLVAAIAAGMVLVLLARSVALLRHDVANTSSGKGEETTILSVRQSWIPPVLAVAVCGLQLTFWEQATSFSGEILDLLIFAFVVRALLEFRIDRDESWFVRSAFVIGLGMANDWAMIGYLPVFAAAVLWTTGFGLFYNRRLMLRMMLWGAAGLSLYLLLPGLGHLTSDGQVTFFAALKGHLKAQKEMLQLLKRPAFLVVALTALLPVIVLSVRWGAHTMQFNDDSRLGVFLTKFAVHFLHALFLVSSIWIAFDPHFSPRHLKLGMSMVTFYYLSALVVGYCAGYFLLMRSGEVPQWVGNTAVAAVWVCVLIVPLALLAINVDEIRFTNGPALRQFARQLYADLPAGKSAVLSDDAQQLLLLRAEAAGHRPEKEPLFVEANSLGSPWYHQFMAERFQSRWPFGAPTNKLEPIGPLKRLNVVARLAKQQPLSYLYPGFGTYFEFYCAVPQGLALRLKARDKKANSAGAPGENSSGSLEPGGSSSECKLDPDVVALNESLWQRRWTELQPVRARLKAAGTGGWVGRLARWLRASSERNATAGFLGASYSRALNRWGVELQRLGRSAEAAVWFGRAIELREDNLAALINLEYNARTQRGDRQRLPGQWLEQQFHQLSGNYADWLDVLAQDGPVDEPTVLFKIAQALLQEGNVRQATQEFARCKELAPDWPEPAGWLALGYINAGDASRALALTQELESRPAAGVELLAELIVCRTSALQQLGRTNDIAPALSEFVSRYGDRTDVMSRAVALFMQNKQFGRAVIFVDHLLSRDPVDLVLLAQKGRAELELSRFEEAIAALTNVTSSVGADDPARLDLALARLRAGHLDAAQADFQTLLKTTRHHDDALFGLGSVAWRKQDTNQAAEFYSAFLSNAVPGLPQYRIARERLEQMTGKVESGAAGTTRN